MNDLAEMVVVDDEPECHLAGIRRQAQAAWDLRLFLETKQDRTTDDAADAITTEIDEIILQVQEVLIWVHDSMTANWWFAISALLAKRFGEFLAFMSALAENWFVLVDIREGARLDISRLATQRDKLFPLFGA